MDSETHTPERPTLLRTKLHQPPNTPDLVPRPRLLERLEGRRRERPLTLVCALAGYGKTTLVSSWLEAPDWPSAWLSLDEDDTDLPLFLAGPPPGRDPDHVPRGGSRNPYRAKCDQPATRANPGRGRIYELDGIESPFILALDDFHIHETDAVTGLDQIVSHCSFGT